MNECILDAILVYRRSHIISHGLHLLIGISHSYPNSSLTNNRNVIAPITKSHRLGNIKSQVFSHNLQALSLISLARCYIRKCRMPSARCTVAQSKHQVSLLFCAAERRKLQDLLVLQDIKTRAEIQVDNTKSLNKNFSDNISRMINHKMTFSHHDDRIIITISISHNLVHISS